MRIFYLFVGHRAGVVILISVVLCVMALLCGDINRPHLLDGNMLVTDLADKHLRVNVQNATLPTRHKIIDTSIYVHIKPQQAQ
jgi:hypothetical protein